MLAWAVYMTASDRASRRKRFARIRELYAEGGLARLLRAIKKGV